MINVLRLDARSASEVDRRTRQTSSLFRASKISSRHCWQPKLAADVAGPAAHVLRAARNSSCLRNSAGGHFCINQAEADMGLGEGVARGFFYEPEFGVFVIFSVSRRGQVED